MTEDGEGTGSATTSTTRQLELAQAIAHVGSWQWDVATGCVMWSDELYRIYGLAPGSRAISLDVFLGALHPDDRDRIRAEIAKVVKQGGPFHYQERIVRPDGSVRTLDTIGEALTAADGKITGVFGTCRDVTDEIRQIATLKFYAEVFEGVEIGLSAWEHLDSGELKLAAHNRAMEHITGLALASRIGAPLAELLPALLDELPAVARAVLAGGAAQELRAVRLSPSRHAPVICTRVFALPGDHIGLALEDISARHRLEACRAGERRALEMLAANAPLGDILAEIVRAMEEAVPETVASIVIVSEDGKYLRHGAGPRLPAALNRMIDGLPIGPSAGSCGRAVYLRAPVYTPDIAADPHWVGYVDLVVPHGLRACWSSPILTPDGRVLGTFALYLPEIAEPEAAAIELMARAAHVAGIVIERRALDEQLRALTARVEAAREDERTTIARDIHDQLGQALTALKLDIGWLARRITDEPLTLKLDEMNRSADEILSTVRRISADLRPGILDEVGLRAAIEWQADEFTRRTQIRCEVHAPAGDLPLDRTLATVAFRIFQEALTNVARHASATRVDVTLGVERGLLRLEIVDDGVGLPEIGPRGTTLGILGMRERARRLGGECTVKRGTAGGTVVVLRAPLQAPKDVGAPW